MHGSAGDRLPDDELDLLVANHQEAVWRYLRFLGAEGSHAEDLLQETFVAIWQKPFERRSPAATRRYLFVVARNLFLMARRRGRVQLQFETIDEAELAWAVYAGDGGKGYLEALRDCLSLLPARSRQAVQMQYFASKPRGEIGRLLGVSVEGVKSLMRRVRIELRDCVREKWEA